MKEPTDETEANEQNDDLDLDSRVWPRSRQSPATSARRQLDLSPDASSPPPHSLYPLRLNPLSQPFHGNSQRYVAMELSAPIAVDAALPVTRCQETATALPMCPYIPCEWRFLLSLETGRLLRSDVTLITGA